MNSRECNLRLALVHDHPPKKKISEQLSVLSIHFQFMSTLTKTLPFIVTVSDFRVCANPQMFELLLTLILEFEILAISFDCHNESVY